MSITLAAMAANLDLQRKIPSELKPADGRFGCGPSKVRPEALARLAERADLMGTSHRQQPVRDLVGRRPRRASASSSSFPTATRWRSATAAPPPSGTPPPPGWCATAPSTSPTASSRRSSRRSTAGGAVPRRPDPDRGRARRRARAGRRPCAPTRSPGPTTRPRPASWSRSRAPPGAGEALVLIDATSGAGGLPLDAAEADAYYFAPQKAFGSDGGLWLALLSPAAIERIEELDGVDGRWQPAFLSLLTALENSRKDQTYNTPGAGDAAAARRPDRVDARLRRARLVRASAPGRRPRTSTAGRSGSELATPFVADPAKRSLVVGTIDFDDSVDAAALAATLRANGIVDVEPYRKLGRNQLRIGMFPAVEPADVEALTACIDWVVENADGVRR